MGMRTPTREEIAKTISVSRQALRGLYRTRLPQMAAALSYRTIFGLIPALVVGLVVLKAFATTDDITQILERALNYTGISQITFTPRSLMLSKRGMMPAKSREAENTNGFISYITTSAGTGTASNGVPYWV